MIWQLAQLPIHRMSSHGFDCLYCSSAMIVAILTLKPENLTKLELAKVELSYSSYTPICPYIVAYHLSRISRSS